MENNLKYKIEIDGKKAKKIGEINFRNNSK